MSIKRVSVNGTLYPIDYSQLDNLPVLDTVPTENSPRGVTSGGVKTALDAKTDSSSVYTKTEVDAALVGKQDTLVFDAAPTSNSTNPVTSNGVHTALAAKQDALVNVPIVATLLPTDYILIERSGTIYKILASEISTTTNENGIETENGEPMLTENGDELLFDV